MRTLTFQEMKMVAGGAQEGDAPPKQKDDAGPSGSAVAVAALRCGMAVAAAKKAPSFSRVSAAAVYCAAAVSATAEYVMNRYGRRG